MKSQKTMYWRFRWNHRHPLHRQLVRFYNSLMRLVPSAAKYRVGARIRRSKLPYMLVGPGSTVVQVGAPRDTLESGRSRGMHLALRTKPSGRVLVIEPDRESCQAFRRLAAEHGLTHVMIHEGGAWDKATTLRLLTDGRHPATNFTDGTVDYGESRLADFTEVEFEADTLTALCQRYDIESVDLVSITANGAEPVIVAGAAHLLESSVRYVALARTGVGYEDLMAEHGFSLVGHDDRGYTFARD